MGKKSTPPPPDYAAAAKETAAGDLANINAQTEANRPNQVTPWGTSQWTNDGGKWTQNVELNPEDQRALDAQRGVSTGRSELAGSMRGRSAGEFGQPMDWDQFGEYTGSIGDGAASRQRAEDASYGAATSRLDPRYEQKRQQSEAGLRAQGLRPGDEAYDTAMSNLGREETDAYNQAMYSSILTGGAEGQRDQNMDLTSGTFSNQARSANVSEEMQKRGFSLNEINAILSGQQIAMPNMPGFNAAGVSKGPDMLNAANMGYQADLDGYSARNAGVNSLLGGLGNAAMMF
eukprot:GHVR01071275.1.p1 GENE.GHVR01071275.1~~GHVR01071275.1.p1  ORF type:complete len:289 (+),score=32.19 GHVR01071275.1:714-1580(+)